MITKRNVEIRHLAPTVWSKMAYRKVILSHVYLIFHVDFISNTQTVTSNEIPP